MLDDQGAQDQSDARAAAEHGGGGAETGGDPFPGHRFADDGEGQWERGHGGALHRAHRDEEADVRGGGAPEGAREEYEQDDHEESSVAVLVAEQAQYGGEDGPAEQECGDQPSGRGGVGVQALREHGHRGNDQGLH